MKRSSTARFMCFVVEVLAVDGRVFPTILIVLDVCAALVYVSHGDWRKVVYWLAAATLTSVVTW